MELINKNILGEVTGTPVQELVQNEFKGETWEVGIYLAMARQAQREGYPEAAQVLSSIAMDEAGHAARFAELLGKLSGTKENIEKMLNGEIEANKGKKEAAEKAREAGLSESAAVLDESSRDEARHAKALEGLLKRYF